MGKEIKKKAKVVDLSGNFIKEKMLPPVFMEEYRPDLIKRAVLAVQSSRLQPKGSDPLAGRNTSAESWGVGRGVSRVPRIKGGRRAARAPQVVGGRRAHPPKTGKILKEKINKKERRKAIRSAIAATINPELVRDRGHRFGGDVELPIIVEDSFADVEKTLDVCEFLKSVGVWEDVIRTKEKKIRAGRGKTRGRRYRSKRGILIVLPHEEGRSRDNKLKLKKAAKNLPGVDVSSVEELNAELLAPGTHPGRLTIWTESSLNFFSEEKTLDDQWEKN